MRLPFGLELVRRPRTAGLHTIPVNNRYAGWPVVREPYPGAWQRNEELALPSVGANPTVYSCATLIAETIAKCRLMLVRGTDTAHGIVWTETRSAAYSPVLRKPNRYQSIQKFVELWIASKLLFGNAYLLKARDDRRVVIGLYVLDPTKVTPLLGPDGSLYYQVDPNPQWTTPTTPALNLEAPIFPASEIIHDLMVPLFHPLVGVGPLYACGLAALQGLKIADNSTTFFANGSRPSGVITSPLPLEPAQAATILKNWNEGHTGAKYGTAGILDNGMKYEATAQSAADAQLIEQLQWSDDTICGCFHVPITLIHTNQATTASPPDQTTQQFYSQCLQAHMTAIALALDDGLSLSDPYATEFAVDDLFWLNAEARTKAAVDAIGSGAMAPNEARFKYFGLGPVKGGDTPYLQQQNYSLAALADRDATNSLAAPPAPAPPPAPPPALPPAPVDDGEFTKALTTARATVVAWLEAGR